MLEAYLASLWKPTDEGAIPGPSEKDSTRSIINDLQRELDSENSIIVLTSKVLAEHQRRARILEQELQKRKLYIAPIRTVPDDILVEILDRARRSDRWQIWRASHVCQRWRNLCCKYTWLWSHIEVDLAVDRPYVGLVQKWRERAWKTRQTIVLRLHLEQFGSLRGMLKGGLKYITCLRLTIPAVTSVPPQFDLPPALPSLRHLALFNDHVHYPFQYIQAKIYIASLSHWLFTRKNTGCRGSVARFHLEFRNLAFNGKFPRAMNRVQTLVLSQCTLTRRSQILQFLEAAMLTLEHLEYTDCWMESSEPLPPTRCLTFPSLLTLRHSAAMSSYQFPILAMLYCPVLTTLTVDADEIAVCTIAQFPALKELCVTGIFYPLDQHFDAPLMRDSTQLATLTMFSTRYFYVSLTARLLGELKLVNPDSYTPSLRRIRLQFYGVSGAVQEVESIFRTAAAAFAERGRDVEFEFRPIQLNSQ